MGQLQNFLEEKMKFWQYSFENFYEILFYLYYDYFTFFNDSFSCCTN